MFKLKKINIPQPDFNIVPIALTDETIIYRKNKVIKAMKENNYDALVVYADLEHGNNFQYLVGFLPRFEEALLVIHQNGQCYLVMGNENLNKVSKARIEAQAVHMPYFSLPNQPMETQRKVSDILKDCEIANCKHIGIVGWKNFTSQLMDNRKLFDVPNYVIEALKEICQGVIDNATYLFIGENGVRTINNANEIAHYSFGAMLASSCILRTIQQLELGESEMQLATSLSHYGQDHNIVTIMATGERFEKANMYPSDKKIKIGDKISITTSYSGGCQSCSGYAVKDENELSNNVKDYIDKVAIPYYNAIVCWLENVKIGITGNEIYQKIQETIPQELYGWKLNPGHLVAEEEWLSSPIYLNSKEIIQSGMIFQLDILPSVKGYGGSNCESTVLLADETLKKEIQEQYPNLYEKMLNRVLFMKKELGIVLSEDILPMADCTAILRPYLLDKESALVKCSE